MAALQIPNPPAGGPWVERYRDVNRFTGEPFIFYESEADDYYSRTVELTLRSDGAASISSGPRCMRLRVIGRMFLSGSVQAMNLRLTWLLNRRP